MLKMKMLSIVDTAEAFGSIVEFLKPLKIDVFEVEIVIFLFWTSRLINIAHRMHNQAL